MTEDQKCWMDNADYEAFLRRNRFGPLGDTIFLDESGKYFLVSMSKAASKLTTNEKATISKRIGWK